LDDLKVFKQSNPHKFQNLSGNSCLSLFQSKVLLPVFFFALENQAINTLSKSINKAPTSIAYTQPTVKSIINQHLYNLEKTDSKLKFKNLLGSLIKFQELCNKLHLLFDK